MTTLGMEELCELSAELEIAAENYLANADLDAMKLTDSWAALRELGWFDLCRDEESGGLGLPPVVLAGVVRAAGRHLVAGPVIEGTLVAPWVSSRAPGQAASLLAADRLLSLVDPMATPLGAPLPTLGPDGTVSGRVAVVPHAADADTLAVVVADVDGATALLVVATDARGVGVERREALAGMHPTGDVVLDAVSGVLVPLEDAALSTLRSWSRILTSAWLAGSAEQVVAMTRDHVVTREQFGRPVGSFQAVQHLVADMAADSATMVNLLSMSVARAGEADGRPDESAALVLKAHAGTAALRVCESALQMHGGIGFTTDHPLHRHYASAMALRSHYGHPEAIHLQLGQRLLAGR